MSEQQAKYVVNLYDRVAHDRTWNNVGFGIADQIDRAMCAAEGIAALQRAADLVTLVDYATDNLAALDMRVTCGLVTVWVVELQAPVQVHEFDGPDAIAKAAAFVRQPPQVRGLFIAGADATDADATSISAAARSLDRADKPGGGE
jgi:hypothetical protein